MFKDNFAKRERPQHSNLNINTAPKLDAENTAADDSSGVKAKTQRKKDPRNFKSITVPMNQAEYDLLGSVSVGLRISLNNVLRLGVKALARELQERSADEISVPESAEQLLASIKGADK